jgi:hypothetical protein
LECPSFINPPTPEYKHLPKKTWQIQIWFKNYCIRLGYLKYLCHEPSNEVSHDYIQLYFIFYCYGGSLEVGQMRSFIFFQSLSNNTSFESYPSSEHVSSVGFYIKPKTAPQILFCLPSSLSSQTLHVKTRKMKIRKKIRYSKIYLKWRILPCIGMS